MKKAKKLQTRRDRLPDRSSELLVNQRILWATRDELKAEIRSVEHKLSGEIKNVSADVQKISADVQKVSADLQKVSADVQKVSADVQRVIALVEVQENRNVAVLDGYQSLHDRQDGLENEFGELKQTVLDFKKFSK